MPSVRKSRGKLAAYAGALAVALLVIAISLGRGSRGADAQGVRGAAGRAIPVSTSASGRFDQAAFWGVIGQTRHEAGNNTGEQASLLEERLSKLPARSIVASEQIMKQLDKGLYTWNVWAAAYVIEDGCSKDCFRDFRRYIIYLGPDAYKKAVTNPDSLAPVVQDAETGDWENADNVAPDAYSSRTGNDFPGDDEDLSGPPRGTPFNENDMAGLQRRYPQLFAKFR
jgi:hypothetical protein